VKDDIDTMFGDLNDRDSVHRAVAGCQAVFHLGALIAIPYSYDAPHSYVRTNVEGTLNVLQAVRAHDVACLVHTSTSEVYGTARYVPIDENHPLQGQSPYSASKIGADKLVESFHHSFGVPCVTVRPFNTYGPRQSARAVIPTIVTQALRGDDIHLGNLSPLRDFTFVHDTVDGFVRAASCPAAIGAVVNLGTGREIAIGTLADLICTLTGSSSRVARSAERERRKGSEVERLCASNHRAQTLLNWRPTCELEQGLTQTIEWIGSNLDRFRPREYCV
jgi:dTDP-glucose 4,6-dehydratase